MSGGESATPGVVDTDETKPLDAAEEFVERAVQRRDGAVPLQMVGLDARDGCGLRSQLQEGAVALVGLDDQPVPRPPHRPAADLVDIAADDERWPAAGFVDNEPQHRGRGRLAVRAGHGEGSAQPADGRQDVGARTHRNPGTARLEDLDIAIRHGT